MISTTAGSRIAGAEQTTGSVAERFRTALRNFRAYRATIAELGALSDTQLADVGVSRAGLREAGRRAVYGISR